MRRGSGGAPEGPSRRARSERQRLSADETLAVWRGRHHWESLLAHCKSAVCWLCVAQGRVYGIVVLAEFRLRFLCGACGAFEFVDGCILVLGRRGHRPYGLVRASPRPGVLASWRPV